MIKNPPAVVAVRIHVDPESIDTSFEGFTANTFQGVATMIRSIQNGGGSMAPPYASLQLPGGYEDRPVQRKTPSRDHGQGPQLQVVFFEGSSAGQTSRECYNLHSTPLL